MASAHLIEDYVRTLDRRLTGPRRVKREMLTEMRDSLIDASEAYEAAGLDTRDAQARAVTEFGSPHRIASAYQIELVASAGRRLAIVVSIFPALAMLFGDRMWQNSPWSSASSAPGDYVILARALDWMTYVLAAAAIAAFVSLRVLARRGGDPRRLCRGLGIGTIAIMSVTTGLGSAIYISTVVMWPAALTWPPMIIGGVVVSAVGATQFVVAARCLRVVRATGIMPVPVAARPETC